MEQILQQLRTAVRGMWKYRWPALLVAWVVTAVGVTVIMKIPDQYEATARIYVDTQSILNPLMAGLAIQPNLDQKVALLSRTLISRPNVEKLVRMADLDLGMRTKAEQEALIAGLMRDLRISQARGDNLYNLSYRHHDRETAQRVIQSLVSIFVESSLGQSRRDTDAAKVFLDEQIRQYEQRLAEAEARVKEFRVRNIDRQLVAGGADSLGRVAELANQLDQARMQLREAEQARDAARSQLAALRGNAAAPAAAAGNAAAAPIQVATPEIDARIDATKRSLDALLLRFTEQHPDVIGARRLITDLEAQKAREVARLQEEARAAAANSPTGEASGSASGSGSFMAQQLGQMVAASEVQVATLRARVAEIASRHQQAIGNLRTSPALEAEFAQLTRDHAVHKRNYDDLVARRETAAMTGQLEVAAGSAEFRLIDPPRVGQQPVAPNRLLLLPLALLAGLGTALALAFVVSQLRPVYHEGGELRLKTQLPLIGVVSVVLSDAARRRHRLEAIKFWSASGSLVLLFAAGMALVALMASRAA
jgi:polysaccharide chain length determinant protein (PEP-CTERM system associated)